MERKIKWNGKDVIASEVFFNPKQPEPFVEYELADCSTIRAKLFVASIIRIHGEYTPEGLPVYILHSETKATVTSAAPHMIHEPEKK